MVEDLHRIIDSKLKRFDNTITSIEQNYDKLRHLAAHSVSGPIYDKYDLLFLLEYAEKKNVDVRAQKEEYGRINAKLTALEKDKGDSYNAKLVSELVDSVGDYCRGVRLFFQLDPVEAETSNDLDGRDIVEFLLIEVRQYTDVSDLEDRVARADGELKKRYMENIEAIVDMRSWIEKSYYPNRFWWRHPFGMLEENVKTGQA